MTSKRNENRKTTAKGFIADPNTQTFTEFSEKIPYTRSLQKAIDLVREEMQLDNSVMVSVTELEQETIKPVVYNPQLVMENMLEDFAERDDAESFCKDGQTVIPYKMHEYSAQVWLFDGANYFTESVSAKSPVKFGKVDARAYIRMRAEENSGSQVIGIHDDNREEITRYAIVDDSQLENCVKTEQ